jgi:hypothetical protein
MASHDYKGRAIRKKTHARYSTNFDRPDLRSLALCSHMKGPHDDAYLTDRTEEVNCGRCLRIRKDRE